MKNITVSARRVFHHRGDLISGVIIVILLCVSVSSLMRKEYMECLNRGLYTDRCVYFTADINGSVNFWDIADKDKIASVSYMAGDIEEALTQYIKYISYGSKVRLPVQSEVYEKFTAEEWNGSQGVAFAGQRLRLDEEDGSKYYYSYEPYMFFRVVGKIGINQTTLTDLFLYVPYDGTMRGAGKAYVAEGDKLSEVLDGLYGVSEYLNGNNLGKLEIVQSGLPDEGRVQSSLIVAILFSVALAVYLYVIYFWLAATRKQTLVLMLFGISKTRIWLHRWAPAALCGFLVFFIWTAVFGVGSGLVGEYMKYWNVSLICLLAVNLLNCVLSFISVFNIKDISRQLK